MAYRYQAPRESAHVWRVANLLLPLFLRLHEQVSHVSVDPEDWARLAPLRHGRALLIANHPSETEPVIMAWLSRKLGRPFNYVATHELFHGFRGWLASRMGAFSVRRGWPDHASLRTSRDLLAEKDRVLVLFPEGETHMQNDLVLPFHAGAAQVGFWALERLAALGKPVGLPIVPIAIRYRFTGDPIPALRKGTACLERRLGLPTDPDRDLAVRLYEAGMAVLSGVEREYGLVPPSADASADARIAALYRQIGARVAAVVHVPAPETGPVHLGMRALFNAVFDYMDGLATGATPYEHRLHERRLVAVQACLNDLWRVQNFMAISGDYLAPPVTPERLGEVLWRLENEVLGRARTRPLRQAVVRIGEPLELANYLDAYRAGRRAAVAASTRELEDRLRRLLGVRGANS